MTADRRRRRPVPLDDALAAYLERSGIGERIEAARVLPEWEERVGDRISSVTRPLRVDGDTLFVAVRSSAWLMELKMMERELVRRLNEGRERGLIGRIRLVMDETGRGGGTATR